MKVIIALTLSAFSCACTSSQAIPPPPPPLPWHINAYIGFDRSEKFEGLDWLYQNSLQIAGSRIKLHKETVSCTSTGLHSTEGDGGASFYEGEIHGSLESGTAVLRYVGCDQCISPPDGSREPQRLPIHQVSPGVIQLGNVVYSRNNRPYPDTCPGDA